MRPVRGRALSLDLRHHAAGQPRPWRPDRASPPILILACGGSTLGLLPRRGAARGAADVRRRLAAAARRARTAVLGQDILPPLLATFGLSVIAAERPAARAFSAGQPAHARAARSRPRRCRSAAASPSACMPLLTFAAAIAGDRRAQRHLLPHARSAAPSAPYVGRSAVHRCS